MSRPVPFEKFREVAPGICEVSCEETRAHLADIVVVDVRRPDEYTGPLGHIKGAMLATLEGDFMQKIEALPREKTIVFVCHAGGRSLRATGQAAALGFEHVFSMAGGMSAWFSAGFERE